MSIAVLVQVYGETRRLAIAGSAVAVGDFRLKKLVAPLEQAGTKAPVFARVAQAVQAVVDSTEKTVSAALLELATLVNAILYTQGETGIAGEFQKIETTDLGTSDTKTSTRVLKPLLDALKSTGSGRLEVVKDAIERNVFNDLRLVKPALHAIDDPYPEIAELIATKVLPMYGKAIVPHLRGTIDLKGRGGHLHRMRLLHKLDAEGTRELVRRALDEGSKELRVVAIECLDTTGSDLSYLLEQVKAKAKDVRAAALRALIGSAAPATDVMDAVKRAIDGADIELIVEALRTTPNSQLRDYVLAKANNQLAETLAAKDPKVQGPAIARLQHLVLSMRGRTESQVEVFLLRCLGDRASLAKISSSPSGSDFNELLANVLAQGTANTRTALAASHKSLPVGMLLPAYEAARETMTPSEFYKEFRPVLAGLAGKRKKKVPEYDRAAALQNVLMSRTYWRFSHVWIEHEADDLANKPKRPELDPKWLDAALDEEAVELACHLARPGHARLNTFLSEQLADRKLMDSEIILEAMVRAWHPGAGDAIIDAIGKLSKSGHHGYVGYWFGRMIPELPKTQLPKFEALLPTLPEKMVDQLIESVFALKNKPD